MLTIMRTNRPGWPTVHFIAIYRSKRGVVPGHPLRDVFQGGGGVVLRPPSRGVPRSGGGCFAPQSLDNATTQAQDPPMDTHHAKLPYRRDLRQKSRILRKSGTLGEVVFWSAVKARRLGYQFRRQVPEEDTGRNTKSGT